MSTEGSDTAHAANREAHRRQAALIREFVQEERPQLSRPEQCRVAGNLFHILEEARRRGVGAAKVLHKSGLGSNTDSTKRAETYVMNPDWPEEKKLRRKLTKSALKYLRIAEAAGQLAAGDVDRFVPDLYAGTPVATVGYAAETEDSLEAELTEEVRRICQGVARKHDLVGVFRHVANRGLCRYQEQLRRNIYGDWKQLWDNATDGMWIEGLLDDQLGWSLPYPHVLLGWAKLAPSRPLQEMIFSVDNSPAGQEGNGTVRAGRICVEVRLAILPVGAGGAPEAALLSFPRLVLDGEPWWEYMYDPPTRRVPRRSFNEAAMEVRALPSRDALENGPVRIQSGPPGWEGACHQFWPSHRPARYHDEYGSTTAVRMDFVSTRSIRALGSLSATCSPLTDVQVDDIAPDQPPARSREVHKARQEDYYEYWQRHKQADEQEEIDDTMFRADRFSLALPLERSLFFTSDERRFDRVLDTVCSQYVDDILDFLDVHDTQRNQVKAQLRKLWQVKS